KAVFSESDSTVEQMLSLAKQQSGDMLSAATRDSNLKVSEADRNAEDMMNEAKTKSAEMLSGAKHECERMTSLATNLKVKLVDLITTVEKNYNIVQSQSTQLRESLEKQVRASEEMLQAQKTALAVLPAFEENDVFKINMDTYFEPIAKDVDVIKMLSVYGLNREREIAPQQISAAGDIRTLNSEYIAEASAKFDELVGTLGRTNNLDVRTFVDENDKATDFSQVNAPTGENSEEKEPEKETEQVFTSGIDYSTDDFSAIADNLRSAIDDAIMSHEAEMKNAAGEVRESEGGIDFSSFSDDDDFDSFDEISEDAGTENEADLFETISAGIKDKLSEMSFSEESDETENTEAAENSKAPYEEEAAETKEEIDSFKIDFSAFEEGSSRKERKAEGKSRKKGFRRK
ncbi:MAG: hypothetical protein IJA39_00465, partial [Clostridia bacterium]|nr:hypothetical protein [Clostridia bacterium]